MNYPDTYTVITSTSAINWFTDVIIPLTSSLIGGILALIGVYITLKRDKIERKHEREENARPFFSVLDFSDAPSISSNNHIFCFSLTGCFDESSPVLTAGLINSDKAPFIITKFVICNHDYLPLRAEMITKDLSFTLRLYYQDDPHQNDVFMHVTDMRHHHRIYKVVCEDRLITDFIEIQEEI